jgi:hypothetical protein
VLPQFLLLLLGGPLPLDFDLLELAEESGPADDLLLVDELELDLGEDRVELRLVLGLEDAPTVVGPDQEAGQPGEEVVEKAREGRVPDDQDDEMDLLTVMGLEVDSLLRTSDGEGDLASRVNSGVGQGDPRADGCRHEVFPVDDPGQEELFVVDELLLGKNV